MDIFFDFFILATDTEISVRNTFGDQLNGLGTSWLDEESPARSKIKNQMDIVFLF